MSGLAAIQSSLQRLQNLGQATTEFDIPAFKMRVKIRLLYSAEEHVVHQIADSAPDETMPYLDTYHWESASRVLMAVWLDGKTIFDFSGVTRMSQDFDREMIEVVVDEGGKEKPVWMDKSSLLKPVLKSWGRDVLNIIFKKFRELSDDQTSKARQGVEFKFATIDDEIAILKARIDVLEARKNNEAIIQKAAGTFVQIAQAPLSAQQAETVEGSLDVRDDRKVQPAEPEPTADLVERRIEDFDNEGPVPEDLAFEEPPVQAAPDPTKQKFITLGDGRQVPVYRHDGGELAEPTPQVSVPTLDAPPDVGVNSRFTGGGRNVRDRSQRD